MITNKEKAIMHLIKKELNLSDDEYRKKLLDITNNRSDSSINLTEIEVRLFLKWAQAKGFRFKSNRKGKITEMQKKRIKLTFKEITKYPDNWEKALLGFLEKRFKIKNLDKITKEKASYIILVLDKMKEAK